MSIYELKPAFQRLLRPLCRILAEFGVTPNQVTVLALILSVATGLLIRANSNNLRILMLLPLVLFARMALNAIDGMLAREHDMKTPLGAMLNELGDVVSDAALYLPLAVVPGLSPTLIVLIVVMSIICEMTGVLAVFVGARRRYDGPMGKSDRAFAFGLLALLLAAGVPIGNWVRIVMVAILLLLTATIVNRTKKALAEIGS